MKHYVVWATARAWGFWAALATTAIGVWLALNLPALKLWFVLFAGSLQILGLIITVTGLAGDAKQFGKHILQVFPEWWSKRPWRVSTGFGGSMAAAQRTTATLTATLSRGLPTDVEGRLAVLEADIVALWKADAKNRNALEEHKTESKKLLDEERLARKDDLHTLEGKLRDYAMGGVHISLLGIWWALLGTLLSLYADGWDAVRMGN